MTDRSRSHHATAPQRDSVTAHNVSPADPAPSADDTTPFALGVPQARAEQPPVPVRTIATTIAMLLVTLLLITVLRRTTRIITWCVIAGFFAVVLTPPVDFLHRRLHLRRGIAATLVFLAGLALIAGMLTAFITPIVNQAPEWANSVKELVQEAQDGKGFIGKQVKRFDLEKKVNDWIDTNKEKINTQASDFAKGALDILGSVGNGIAATLTIAVLTIFMIMEGPQLLRTSIRILSPPQQLRISRVGHDCAKAITGYVAGNLAISVIAGLATYTFLLIVGVPFAAVLALWVAFADLIPLVGATMGAIPTVLVAFLHSVPAGIATVVFYVVYQQIENHVLQTTIMARTVAIKPLVVLVSVLVGVELFGLLGALLAIPFAGIIKVVATDILAFRRPDLAPVGHARRNRESATPLN